MFDLIVKDHRRTPHRDTVPMMMSIGVHVTAAALLIVIPLMAYDVLPTPPSMMSVFAAAPPPPAPPPPPPPPEPAQAQPAVELNPSAAPVEAPKEIAAEPPAADVDLSGAERLAGGIVAGVASLEALPPPAPPPPPLPHPPAVPVRIGGQVRQPPLLSRVPPAYPLLAVSSRVEGVVILEALVDREGHVEDVKVLRSIPLLDGAAMDAVRQWRYAPLVLHGQPVRFLVTVTVAFQLAPR
jgi:protein TonB